MGVLTQAKMMVNIFENRNFMHPMGRLNMHSKCLDFGCTPSFHRIFYFGEPP
jgi:hypothetical protein